MTWLEWGSKYQVDEECMGVITALQDATRRRDRKGGDFGDSRLGRDVDSEDK